MSLTGTQHQSQRTHDLATLHGLHQKPFARFKRKSPSSTLCFVSTSHATSLPALLNTNVVSQQLRASQRACSASYTIQRQRNLLKASAVVVNAVLLK